jgi:hypothetical protein
MTHSFNGTHPGLSMVNVPTPRQIDRCDTPTSYRSQISALSGSDNRSITNLHNEKPILAVNDATTP